MKKFNISLTNMNNWSLGGLAIEFSRYDTIDKYKTTYLYILKRKDIIYNIEYHSQDNLMDRSLDVPMYSDQYIRTIKFLMFELVKETFVASKE